MVDANLSKCTFVVIGKLKISLTLPCMEAWWKGLKVYWYIPVWCKDFRASGLGQDRHLTAATAAIILACLFVEMLCYVLGRRLHSSCVLSTRIGLHRIEVINATLVNDDFSKKTLILYLFMFKAITSENFSFQSYQNKNL